MITETTTTKDTCQDCGKGYDPEYIDGKAQCHDCPEHKDEHAEACEKQRADENFSCS